MDFLVQTCILVFSAAAIFLVSCKERRHRRWGFICGLVSQPFWFYTTWKHWQWGAFLLSCWYTGSWINGLRNSRAGTGKGEDNG
jgi:hypothetical protein